MVIGRVQNNVNSASVIAKEEIDKRTNLKMSELGNDKFDVSLEEEKDAVNEKELEKGEPKEEAERVEEGEEKKKKKRLRKREKKKRKEMRKKRMEKKEKGDGEGEEQSQISEEEGEDEEEKEMDSKEIHDVEFEKLLQHQMDSNVGSRDKVCYTFPLRWIVKKCYNYEEIWCSIERYCQYSETKFPKGHFEEAAVLCFPHGIPPILLKAKAGRKGGEFIRSGLKKRLMSFLRTSSQRSLYSVNATGHNFSV
jgi:hypothetical protein